MHLLTICVKIPVCNTILYISFTANINLKLERPVKANVSFVRLKQVENFLETLMPTKQGREPSPKPQSESKRHVQKAPTHSRGK